MGEGLAVLASSRNTVRTMATRDIYESGFDEDVRTESSANQCPECDGRVNSCHERGRTGLRGLWPGHRRTANRSRTRVASVRRGARANWAFGKGTPKRTTSIRGPSGASSRATAEITSCSKAGQRYPNCISRSRGDSRKILILASKGSARDPNRSSERSSIRLLTALASISRYGSITNPSRTTTRPTTSTSAFSTAPSSTTPTRPVSM